MLRKFLTITHEFIPKKKKEYVPLEVVRNFRTFSGKLLFGATFNRNFQIF